YLEVDGGVDDQVDTERIAKLFEHHAQVFLFVVQFHHVVGGRRARRRCFAEAAKLYYAAFAIDVGGRIRTGFFLHLWRGRGGTGRQRLGDRGRGRSGGDGRLQGGTGAKAQAQQQGQGHARVRGWLERICGHTALHQK